MLLIGLFSLFLLTHPGYDDSEAVFHYSIAQQIIRHGSLSFAEHKEGIYFVAPNGRTYASHELGNTLFLLPIAVVNRAVEAGLAPRLGPSRTEMVTRFLFGAMGPVLGALGGLVLYLMLRLVFFQSRRDATFGVLISCFCSFYWTYTRDIFDGVLCGVALLTGMLFLFLFGKKPDRHALLIAAFACFGFGFITRISMVLPLAVAGGFLLLIRKRIPRFSQTVLIAAVTAAPFVAWQLFYNHLRTGTLLSPVQMPLYEGSLGLTHGGMLVGLIGLLSSPGKSVLVYCPIVLLSVIAFPRFWKAHRNEAIFVGTLFGLWLVLHAKLPAWWGMWGFGPRYFITVAQVIAIPFLVSRFEMRSLFVRGLKTIVLSWGFLLAAASVICNARYRMTMAFRAGIFDTDYIWNIGKSQAVDQVVGAFGNVARTFTGGPYVVLPDFSPIDVAASNTVNLWFFTAARLGISRPLLAAVVVILFAAAIASLSSLMSSKTLKTEGVS